MADIVSIQISAVREVPANGSPEWWDKEWRTGFYKSERTQPLWLGYEGLRGDEQSDRRVHGGVDKAICVYSAEHYAYWQKHLALEMPHGAFGENFTTQGLMEAETCIGDVYEVGEAVVQVAQPRQPCWKLARRWQVKDLTLQVDRTGFTGFYFRVLQHGRVVKGDTFTLKERPWPQWTIQRSNQVMLGEPDDGGSSARELASCPALAGSWKDALWRGAERH